MGTDNVLGRVHFRWALMTGPVGTQSLPVCLSVILDTIFLFLLLWSFFPAPAEAPESLHVLDFLRDFFWSDRDCDGNCHPTSCRGPALGLQGSLLFLLFLSFPTLQFSLSFFRSCPPSSFRFLYREPQMKRGPGSAVPG